MAQVLEIFKSYFSVVWGVGLIVYGALRVVSNVLFSNADKICIEKNIRPHECQYSIEWQLCLNRHNIADNIASCWFMLVAGAVVPMFLFFANNVVGIVAWVVLAIIVIANLVNRLAFDWLTWYEYKEKYKKGYRYEIPYYPIWESSSKQLLFFETKDEFTSACEKIYRSEHVPAKACDDLLRNFEYYPNLEVVDDPFHYRFPRVPVYNTKFVEVVNAYERESECEGFDDFRREVRVQEKD